jgi:hypothetical protein
VKSVNYPIIANIVIPYDELRRINIYNKTIKSPTADDYIWRSGKVRCGSGVMVP